MDATDCLTLLFAGAPTNYGLYETFKQHWLQDRQQMSMQYDTTYRWSYSYWSPEHYLGVRYSTGSHLPLLRCKPLEYTSSLVDTTKPDCSCSKAVSIEPRGVMSSAVQSPCYSSVNNAVSQQAQPPIAAL